jgi:uncharacterized repeat protein (TIGR01451 family)
MIRRLIDWMQHTTPRTKLQIAGLAVALAAGGPAVWYGSSLFRTSTPTGPIKQVATGIKPVEVSAGAVQPAVASLSDDQLPAGATTETRSAPQPQVNPYLPTSSDPPGGYGTGGGGSSRFSGASSLYSQYAQNDASAAVPADPTASETAAEPPPENIYRPSGRSVQDLAADAIAQPPTAPSPSTYSGGDYASLPATSPPGAAPDAAEVAASSPPPNPLPQADFGNSPYAIAPSPPQRMPSATIPSTPSSAGGSNSPLAAPLGGARSLAPSPSANRTDGNARLAAPTPGERQFEGPQQPSLALEKISPGEIQVGKPATFELYVRNVGQAPANGVVVTDHVPAGTQLLDARPAPQQAADGSLVWNLGTMQPGDQTQITLQVMPQTEGEIGSTAHVTFASAATSRSICTRPQLAIEHTAPPKVLIGEALTVAITISNPGTGAATGVIIEEDVPAGLVHVAGSQLEYEVGTLRPGESKRLDLILRADKPGIVQNVIRVRGDASLAAQHATQIEVVAPQLQVGVEGPKVRFLERQATYTLQVANPGTAAARDVELVARLPRGMRFISTDSQGQYDMSQHAVYWSLAELPPATRGAVKLTTLPVEPGDQPLRIEGRGALGVTAASEQIVRVEQAAELVHSVKDLDEVIEVGSETTYEIRVLNKGTKAASNVRVAAMMSPGMAAIHGEGPTRAAGDATQVAFEPLARLSPNEEVIYKVQAQGRQPGDQIIRVQVSSDEWPSPVTREESTRVYQDR